VERDGLLLPITLIAEMAEAKLGASLKCLFAACMDEAFSGSFVAALLWMTIP